MLFAFMLLDAPGTAALRQQVRPEHKAYLAGVYATQEVHAFCNLRPKKTGFPES